jgi:hypothetical protein
MNGGTRCKRTKHEPSIRNPLCTPGFPRNGALSRAPSNILHHSHVALTHLLQLADLFLPACNDLFRRRYRSSRLPERRRVDTFTDNHDPNSIVCFNITPSEPKCSQTNHWLKSGPGWQCCDRNPSGNHVRPDECERHPSTHPRYATLQKRAGL